MGVYNLKHYTTLHVILTKKNIVLSAELAILIVAKNFNISNQVMCVGSVWHFLRTLFLVFVDVDERKVRIDGDEFVDMFKDKCKVKEEGGREKATAMDMLFMTDDQKRMLICNRVFLVRNVQVTEDLILYMRNEDVLTDLMVEELCSIGLCPTRANKVRYLLEKVR